MAYPRQPSSKSGGRVPVDDTWHSSGGPPGGGPQGPPLSQSHRQYPISSNIVGGGDGRGGLNERALDVRSGGHAITSSERLLGMLDAVRQEFEGLIHDNSALKNQREEMEAKANQSIQELSSIKSAVQELESYFQKTRQGYEDELARLRSENSVLRAAAAANAPANGTGPPPSVGTSQLGLSLPPAGSSQGIERGGYGGDSYDIKARKPDSAKPGEYHNQAQRTPPNHPQDIALRNGTPPYEFPSSLSPNSVPASLRKEGADWFLMYNPRLPQKTLDVTLLHQFNHESVVCCVRFSKDGRFLATGCNRTAQIFDMRNGQMVCQLSDETAVMEGDLYIRSVCFSPDGKYLATGAEDRQIRIWDIAKKRIFRNFTGHEQEIYSLDFSYDGHLIVSGSGDKTARIWDMETGNATILSINDNANADGDVTMGEGVASDAGVTSVAISPDGKLVAAGSLDTIVRLWDVRTGTLLERLKGHRDSVYSVAFTPDGLGLVSGSLDKTLKYWELNIRDGKPTSAVERERGEKYAKCLLNFVGHKDYVLSVAISDDGRWIVSGSKDRGVQFWDKNGVAQLMLQGHKNSVISIDLSPVGGHLATGSGDWQARVWSYKVL